MWHSLEKKYKAQLFIIECILREDEHKKRLQERVRNIHGIAEVTWKDVEKRKKEYIPWQEEKLTVETDQPHEENVKKVLRYITT